MDQEAVPSASGIPTGLNWYGGHSRRELKRPQSEPEWSKRLARLLTEGGYPAQYEVPYPNLTRCRCDLVVNLGASVRFWIEVKGAWKHYWNAQIGSEFLYRSYLYHPLLPGLDQTKTHTAALDLEKLRSLSSVDARYVGLLLIGFDSSLHDMANDINAFKKLATLHKKPWCEDYRHWPDARRPKERVRCWFWHRCQL